MNRSFDSWILAVNATRCHVQFGLIQRCVAIEAFISMFVAALEFNKYRALGFFRLIKDNPAHHLQSAAIYQLKCFAYCKPGNKTVEFELTDQKGMAFEKHR